MKKIVIAVIVLAIFVILSFIMPIRKEEKWLVAQDNNPKEFWGQGSTKTEKYENNGSIILVGVERKR